jgi:polyisoprenoid-binding protein YceI
MVMKVRGHFADVRGAVHIEENLEDSWAEVVIGAASLDTGTPDRDNHLRSPDFLNVEKFPEIRFRSTGVELLGGTKFKVRGDLTILDVTRPVVLDGEFEGIVRDPWGKTRAVYSAETVINREDWGMSWNVALEAGGWLVSKEVGIEIEVETVYSEPESDTISVP